jgi:hypothetical protein
MQPAHCHEMSRIADIVSLELLDSVQRFKIPGVQYSYLCCLKSYEILQRLVLGVPGLVCFFDQPRSSPALKVASVSSN